MTLPLVCEGSTEATAERARRLPRVVCVALSWAPWKLLSKLSADFTPESSALSSAVLEKRKKENTRGGDDCHLLSLLHSHDFISYRETVCGIEDAGSPFWVEQMLPEGSPPRDARDEPRPGFWVRCVSFHGGDTVLTPEDVARAQMHCRRAGWRCTAMRTFSPAAQSLQRPSSYCLQAESEAFVQQSRVTSACGANDRLLSLQPIAAQF
ncbi:hypothetical protein EI555_002605 [Monodon monoceros]|uniref:Uncharacterized protein n=1 Tax=Monodon monoceros TaxID=40151 RepID=A0A4U1EZ29_MONMO|nr:hypothetical protein EI555_002605 [Monodon monoceros]